MDKVQVDVWHDISAESERMYVLPNGQYYHINEPSKVMIRPSGSHRVVDKSGTCHIVPDYQVIRFKSKTGDFSF